MDEPSERVSMLLSMRMPLESHVLEHSPQLLWACGPYLVCLDLLSRADLLPELIVSLVLAMLQIHLPDVSIALLTRLTTSPNMVTTVYS